MSPRATTESPPQKESRAPSLRARLWIGALGGTLVTAVAVGSVLAALWLSGPTLAPGTVMVWLTVAVLVGILASLLFAQWLERGIVSGLRRLLHALTTGQPPDRRDLEQAPEWGEIGIALERLADQLQQQRTLGRAGSELQLARAEVLRFSEALERWMATERWEPVETTASVLAALADTLNRAMAREHAVMDRNQEAARVVSGDLQHTVDEARDAADEAEHGFVEANALLTTVREIARVGSELQQLAVSPNRVTGPDRADDWRRRAAESLESLVSVSSESVEHLGNGLLRVQEVGAQVQLLSNRATLIALNALLAGEHPHPLGAESGDDWATDLKQLAREVRGATERISQLSADVAREVEAANARMNQARARVLQALAPKSEAETPVTVEAAPDVTRLGERLREMAQDALRKGERMAEAGERASRAAERLVRRLEDQSRDLEGLVARLTPTGDVALAPLQARPMPAASLPASEPTGRSGPEAGGRSGESSPRLRLFASGGDRPEGPRGRDREERP
jgi:methyl-accepting chemotaxis protein